MAESAEATELRAKILEAETHRDALNALILNHPLQRQHPQHYTLQHSWNQVNVRILALKNELAAELAKAPA